MMDISEPAEYAMLGLLHSQPMHGYEMIQQFNLLNTAASPRLIVFDQFENLLNWETGRALPDRPGAGDFLDACNSQACICRILLTSRPRPRGMGEQPLTYLHDYPVDGLTVAEGINLLQRRGVQGTEVELQKAVESCHGHGLALELLIQLLDKRRLSLSALLKNTALWDGHVAINLLDYIYNYQLHDEERILLQAFSIYREAVPIEAVEVLTDEQAHIDIDTTIEVLLTQHLLQAAGQDYYQLHTLVSRYAQQRAVKENIQERQSAHAKAAQSYLQKAAQTCPARNQGRNISHVSPFIEAVWHYSQAGQWPEAYELMHEEHLFADLRRWGANAMLLELCQSLISGKWQPEPAQSAVIVSNMAFVYNVLGNKQEALKYFEQALRIFREVGDRGGEGTTFWNIGAFYFEHEDRYSASLACLLLAKQLFEQVQSPNRDVVQEWIDALHRRVGDKQFAELLAQVEPRAEQIVEEALRDDREKS